MKLGSITYKPSTNWATAILLAALMLGFGAFAESRTHHPVTPDVASDNADGKDTPQAFLRLF